MFSIYFQVLSFRQDDFTNITRGHVINLIASDLQRFEVAVNTMPLILEVIISCFVCFFLMFHLFGWNAMPGMLFLLTFTIYYGFVGRLCATLRYKTSIVADKRVDLMNAIISGIRTVKMYAWEWSFMRRVLLARS